MSDDAETSPFFPDNNTSLAHQEGHTNPVNRSVDQEPQQGTRTVMESNNASSVTGGENHTNLEESGEGRTIYNATPDPGTDSQDTETSHSDDNIDTVPKPIFEGIRQLAVSIMS